MVSSRRCFATGISTVRVTPLKQWDILRSRCPLNREHLSLHCCRNVSTVLFEIILGGQTSSARRTTSRVPLAVGLTSSILCFQAERIHHYVHDLLSDRIHHDLLDFYVSLLLSCLDDFLVLHDFLVEVDLRDGRDSFALPLLNICIAGCSFLLYCVSPRTSPCLGRSPSVCFAGRWLCSFLACLWLCSLASRWLCSSGCLWRCSSACCWLCSSCLLSALLLSVLFIFAPDLCVLLAVLVPLLLYFVLVTTASLAVVLSRISHHLLLGCGSFGVSPFPQALWLWIRLCFPPESLLWLVTTPWFFFGFLQHHYSALWPAVSALDP